MAEVGTEYPKWVDHPSDTTGETAKGEKIPKRVLVKDKKEEDELVGKAAPKDEKKPAGWTPPKT